MKSHTLVTARLNWSSIAANTCIRVECRIFRFGVGMLVMWTLCWYTLRSSNRFQLDDLSMCHC